MLQFRLLVAHFLLLVLALASGEAERGEVRRGLFLGADYAENTKKIPHPCRGGARGGVGDTL